VVASVEQLINKNLITLDLNAKDKDSVMEELAALMDKQDKLHSKSEFLKAVHEREAFTTTAVGLGVAIPHARSPAVRETAISFGKSKGFHWDGDEDEVVRLVFLLAVPRVNPNKEYIELLAALARMLVDEGFRDSLMKARNYNDVIMAMEKVCVGRDRGIVRNSVS